MGIVLMVLLVACSKDDAPQPKDPDPVQQQVPKPEPEPENRAPEIPVLFAPRDTDDNVELADLELKLQHVTDPDGDAVRFDVFLDQQNPPTAFIASGLTTSTYTLDEKLEAEKTYFWKIVAKDGKGSTSESSSASFTTRPPDTDELIIGKWVLESATSNGEPSELSDCGKQTNYQFKNEGVLIFENFFLINEDECRFSKIAYQYELLGDGILRISRENVTILDQIILSISETELIFRGGSATETYRRVS